MVSSTHTKTQLKQKYAWKPWKGAGSNCNCPSKFEPQGKLPTLTDNHSKPLGDQGTDSVKDKGTMHIKMIELNPGLVQVLT